MRPYKKVTIIILGIALFVAGSVFLIFLKRESKLNQADMPVSVDHLLTTYSNSLNSGTINDPSAFSDEMLSLVAERRSFYAEYFEKAWYSELEVLETQFLTDQMTVSDNGASILVDIREIVIIGGHPLIQKAEEYPLVAAADWAIAATDDENVREALKQYQSFRMESVNDSILNGIEIALRVQHTIEIVEQDGQFQIACDEFTDKEIGNGNGHDNVTWVDGKPQRQYPDSTTMVEYSTYNTPIEVLGQNLLDDFTRTHGISTNNNLTETPAPFTLPAFTPSDDWQEYSSEYTYTARYSPDGSTGFLKYSLRYPAGWFLYPGSTISEPGLEGQTYLMNFERVGTDMWYQPLTAGRVQIAIYALPCFTSDQCRTDVPELQTGVFVYRKIVEPNPINGTTWEVIINAKGFRLSLTGYMPGASEDNADLIETLDQILSTVKILDSGMTMPTGTPLPTP